MKIYHLYRDFFRFLKSLEVEKDIWKSFREYYFDKYRDFLSVVWFKYQKYSLRLIRDRVLSIKNGDYSYVEASLKLYDIESNTKLIINDCRKILYTPEVCHIYLFIGFFSPDAFVVKYNNRYVIAVGLERFHNFSNYPILLSHEYCHYVQNMISGELKENKLVKKLVREGIAIYFTKVLFFKNSKYQFNPWDYIFTDRQTYNFLNERFETYINELIEQNFNIDEDVFHGVNDRFYPKSGYFLAFKIIDRIVSSYFKNKDVIDLIKSEDYIADNIKLLLK